LALDLTSTQKKVLLKRISADYAWASHDREDRASDWEDWRAQYEGEWRKLEKVAKDDDLEKYLFVPMTRRHVDRVHATLMNHFFPGAGAAKLGKVTPRGATDPQAADWLDQVLHVKLDLELRPRMIFDSAFHAALVEESGVLMAWWEDGGPRLQFLFNEHVSWDPYAAQDSEIRFFCREYWISQDELWDRYDAGEYEDIPEMPKGADEARQNKWIEHVGGPENAPQYRYKLVEYWGPVQLVDDPDLTDMHERKKHEGSKHIRAIFHDDKVVLRVREAPYADLLNNPTPYEKLPFWIGKIIARHGRTYGWSLCEMLQPLQAERNKQRNQRLQAIDIEQTGKVMFDVDRVSAKDVSKARLGGGIPVDGPIGDSIQYFQPRTSTQGMVQEEGFHEQEAEQLTGVTPMHWGQNPTGVDTATQATILTQEGNATQNSRIGTVAETLVLPVLKFFAECCKQKVSWDEVSKICGLPKWDEELAQQQGLEKPKNLAEFIQEDYDIEVEAGPSASSKAVQVRDLQNALGVLGQIAGVPEVAPTAVPAVQLVVSDLLKLLGVHKAAEMLGGGGPQPGGPAGAAPQQPGGIPNPANQRSLATQGRTATPEETPAPRRTR